MFQRIQGIGKVRAQRFQQADLFRVEGIGIGGIEGQRPDDFALAVQRKGGRGAKAVRSGRLAPGGGCRVDREIVVDHRPVLANAGPRGTAAQPALHLHADLS